MNEGQHVLDAVHTYNNNDSIDPLTKPADETQSEEEPSRSKVSSLWSPFLYMLLEKWP